jgi:hypothetical protein
MYYYLEQDGQILLLLIFSNNEQDNLTAAMFSSQGLARFEQALFLSEWVQMGAKSCPVALRFSHRPRSQHECTRPVLGADRYARAAA